MTLLPIADLPPSDEQIDRTIDSAAEGLVSDLMPVQSASDNWNRGEIAYPAIAAAMSRCLEQLQQTGLSGQANRGPSARLWNIAHSILEVGDLQLHARMKPRGYAGDFEMLAKIFLQSRCEHRLGRWFDQFFQAQAAPTAVRNRMQMVASDIVSAAAATTGPLKISVIGCGSALDVKQALETLSAADRERISLVLLDLDPRAVEAAEVNLQTLLAPEQVRLAATNLLRLPRRAADRQAIDGSQRIYCTGLFDYFDDQQSADMLATFHQHLAAGGESLVFQFSETNPTRGYMEWIGNWYLRYRSLEDLDRIRKTAGISQLQCELTSEPLGVNLCWKLRH